MNDYTTSRPSGKPNPQAARPMVIAQWARNARENVRVALSRYQDRDIVDVRTWVVAIDGSEQPTKTGITLAVRHLPQLAEALNAALCTGHAVKIARRFAAWSTGDALPLFRASTATAPEPH